MFISSFSESSKELASFHATGSSHLVLLHDPRLKVKHLAGCPLFCNSICMLEVPFTEKFGVSVSVSVLLLFLQHKYIHLQNNLLEITL